MTVETVEYKGYKIQVEYDQDANNPRGDDFDCSFGKMVCSHKRYNMPNDADVVFDSYDSWEEVEKAIEQEHGKSVILPVYMYEHSGVALNTTGFSCQWDSGRLGLIFVSHEDIRKQYSVSRATKKQQGKAIEALKAEVETYSNYLNGEVYGYVIANGEDEHIDSCWGFYGSDHEKNGLLETAKNQIDSM